MLGIKISQGKVVIFLIYFFRNPKCPAVMMIDFVILQAKHLMEVLLFQPNDFSIKNLYNLSPDLLSVSFAFCLESLYNF